MEVQKITKKSKQRDRVRHGKTKDYQEQQTETDKGTERWKFIKNSKERDRGRGVRMEDYQETAEKQRKG